VFLAACAALAALGCGLTGCELALNTGSLTERSDDGGGMDSTVPLESGGDGAPMDSTSTEGSTTDANKDAPADTSSVPPDGSGGCVIGGMTYASGAVNPASPKCQTCDPTNSASAWTDASEGTSCGTAVICHAGMCASGCVVGGTYYAASAMDPNDACHVCTPSMSTSAWTNAMDGNNCGGGQVCSAGQCGTQCVIGGMMYASGATNPSDVCQSCQPGKSASAWSTLSDGSGCGTAGMICASGQCTADCFIGGTVYGSGVANAANSCQTCQPGMNTMAWTTLGNGATCGTGSGMVCYQGNCAACAAGTMCTPSTNVCDKGTVVCTSGQPACPDPGTPDPAQNGKACTTAGGASGICQSGSCQQQFTVTQASVTATQNYPVYGPIAFVTDALTTDVATSLKAQIDWGDGTMGPGVFSGGSGSFVVNGSHTYATTVGASVTITVTVSDATTSASGKVSYSATVRPAATGIPKLFPTTTGSAGPEQITVGPDQNLWFTEFGANQVAQITTAGAITEIKPTTASSNPRGIASGPGGLVWYSEYSQNQVGYLKPGGGPFGEYMLSMSYYDPGILRLGPDGNLWLSSLGGVLYRIGSGGSYLTFSVPSGSIDISAGSPDGNLWFTDGSIAHISTSGTGYASFKTTAATNGIAMGPDTNLWVTEPTLPGIARCTTSGVVTEFLVTNPGAFPYFITTGADGNVWFTDIGTTTVAIGRITPTGAITEFPLSSGSNPYGIVAGPDGNVWYADNGGSQIGRMTP
jgi:streptogramin lyase